MGNLKLKRKDENLSKVFPKKDNFSRFTTKVAKWLGKKGCNLPSQDLNLALKVLEKILRILETRGKAECVRYTKEIRLGFQKGIFNIPPDWSDVDVRKVPKILRPVMRRIVDTKNYPLIRLVLSVLFSTRALRAEVNPSFSTIEGEPLYKYKNATFLGGEMRNFLKINGVKRKQMGKKPRKLNFSQFHMTSKSGPNGHALWSSYLDFMSLTKEQKEDIATLAGDKIIDLGNRFQSIYQSFTNFFDGMSSPRKGITITRKIICIQDKEMKTREVAILDYWSQCALLPLHNYQLRFLSNVAQDCTLNQTKRFKSLRAKPGNHYWSIDLTAATDRFPILIQHQFLTMWFGLEYANAWKRLMVGTPFLYKDRELTYKVGNPMGAYSSFNTFAICHHFLVYLACKRVKINWKKCPYMLLGDDIVIANDKVALAYMKILKSWDVNVSMQKTHKSKNGFEFAKQIRLHNKNISHFPISALFDRRSETFTSAGIIASEVWNKDWNIDLSSMLKSYFLDIIGWSTPRFRAFQPELELSINILGFLKGQRKLGDGILHYVNSKTGKDYQMPGSDSGLYAKTLLLHLIHSTFLRSREAVISSENKKPLGELVTNMVILITSLPNEDEVGGHFSNIEAIPFVQIYGRAEETWLSLRTDLSIYQLGESEQIFRKMFGKINIPGSDDDFHTRHRDIVMIQAAKAAKQLGQMIFTIPRVKDDRVELDITVPWTSDIKQDLSDNYSFQKV